MSVTLRRNAVPPKTALLSWCSFFGLRPLIFGEPYRTFGLSVSKTHYVLHIEIMIPHENQCFCNKIYQKSIMTLLEKFMLRC